MKKYFIFIIVVMVFSIQAMGQLLPALSIIGETGQVIPETPYTYYQHNPYVERSTHTWTVTNGKIRDSNGNYTLSTITTSRSDTKIYVKWEGVGSTTRQGTIKVSAPYENYTTSETKYPTISPYNLVVSNQTITGSAAREYIAPTVSFTNVTFSSGTNATVNGYNWVTLNSTFNAVYGSEITITSKQPTTPIESAALIAFEASEKYGTINPLDVAVLEQNMPNPAISITHIGYYIPDYVSNAYIQIQDVYGNIFRKDWVGSDRGEIELDCTQLAKGVYLYSLIVDDNIIDTKRMIVTH